MVDKILKEWQGMYFARKFVLLIFPSSNHTVYFCFPLACGWPKLVAVVWFVKFSFYISVNAFLKINQLGQRVSKAYNADTHKYRFYAI